MRLYTEQKYGIEALKRRYGIEALKRSAVTEEFR